LLTCRGVAEAAAAAGVGKRTLFRWLAQDDQFRAALAAEEGRVLDGVTRRLLALADAATDHLAGVLTGPMTTDQTRLRAIDMILSHLLRLRELNTLEERVSRLEEAIHGDHRKATD